MKSKLITLGISLLAGMSLGHAAQINVPDWNFQNVNAAINPPLLLGTTSGSIGTWSAQFSGLLSLGGHLDCSNAVTVGWPAAPGATYELQIDLPATVAASAGISETITNRLQPDSVYTLSVELSQGTTLNLLSGATLSLSAGPAGASMNGGALASVLNTSSSFQTVYLTYKTGNTVPTNAINIALDIDGTASVGGDIYVSDFQLSVAPIQVQVDSTFTSSSGGGGNGGSSITLNGSGGAPGATYEVMDTTNLLAPVADWTVISTNHFDSNGEFSLSFPVNTGEPCRYYKTLVP